LGFSPEVPAALVKVERKQEQYQTMANDYAAFHTLLLERYGSQ
jgi:hypothetical protein